ncbi:MAG: penicillin-binding protein activator [Candidatus Malihini olakiniferum]
MVGALLKNDIEQLTNQQTAVNILVLNQLEHAQHILNMCFFSLSPEFFAFSPEYEARDAAQFIHRQGKQQPLLIVPAAHLGNRVIKICQAWKSQGGTIRLS